VAAADSPTAATARAFASAYRIERAHGSYEALAADGEIDVFYVATPHSGHFAAARRLRLFAEIGMRFSLPVRGVRTDCGCVPRAMREGCHGGRRDRALRVVPVGRVGAARLRRGGDSVAAGLGGYSGIGQGADEADKRGVVHVAGGGDGAAGGAAGDDHLAVADD
jgi:hypothetical protein